MVIVTEKDVSCLREQTAPSVLKCLLNNSREYSSPLMETSLNVRSFLITASPKFRVSRRNFIVAISSPSVEKTRNRWWTWAVTLSHTCRCVTRAPECACKRLCNAGTYPLPCCIPLSWRTRHCVVQRVSTVFPVWPYTEINIFSTCRRTKNLHPLLRLPSQAPSRYLSVFWYNCQIFPSP